MTPSLRQDVLGLLVLAALVLPWAACRDHSGGRTTSAPARSTEAGTALGRAAAATPAPATPRLEAATTAALSVTAEAEPQHGAAPLSVQFRAEVASAPSGLQYCWDFGDGSAACQLLARHRYENPGRYAAQLSITGPGVNEVRIVLVEVTDPGFKVEADADPDIGPVPLTVQFSATVEDEVARPLAFHWDFGDGAQDAANPSVHTYRTPGTYTATLTVTSATGRVTHQDVEIQVDAQEDE